MYKLSNTFETWLSDHHKLISTIAKYGSLKGRPRKKIIDAITFEPYLDFEKAFRQYYINKLH